MGSVVVAVLTYRRNELVAEIMGPLAAQVRGLGRPGHVLVVDNDPHGGARQIVEGRDPDVHYVHEPKPGIAAGRNRALDCVGDDDTIVFIDDDEEPADGWLNALVDCQRTTGADAVVGCVEPVFEEPLDTWLAAGGFFARPRHPTGTKVVAGATNNLLLQMAVVRRLNLRFDEDFGLSGGSDTLFTRQLMARGGTLIWCDEAVVRELVPADRAVRKWALRRWFRSGNTWGRTSLRMADDRRARRRAQAQIVTDGLTRMLGGLLQLAWGSTSRSRVGSQAQGARRAARGLGMLSAAFGYVYVEYRRRNPTGRRRFAGRRRL